MRFSLISEDTRYKRHMLTSFVPELYERHIESGHVSCIYCASLVRSDCHRHCFKCSIGTHIYCSPLLPGMLASGSDDLHRGAGENIPWYYRKPCNKFRRLPREHYLKNLLTFLDPISIYNLEILEGLEQGLSSGERPCFGCASIDYEIYRSCSVRADYDRTAPCSRIRVVLENCYFPVVQDGR